MWEKDKMNGKGLFLFNNGDSYDGNFLNNSKNGYGIYTENKKKY